MATSWRELFITNAAAPEPAAVAAADEPERAGFFRRLRENMSKTREALGAELRATVFDTLDDETWERIEETLIYADVGAAATARIVEKREAEAAAGDLEPGEPLVARLRELLAEAARTEPPETIALRHDPAVIWVVGVNGTGKTTTIGKIAWHLQKELGRSVLLAAADTYRAAAVEQLDTWAQRAGADIVKAEEGGDPGAVAYDALEAARARDNDVVICDTAG